MDKAIPEKKKVLFVDDEINILKSLRRELFQSKFEVITTNSAVEGLEILEKEKIAVVVSDVKMPNMDGLQFLGIVKETYPDINRVILSGFVEQSSVVSSIIREIATTYFAKPWDTEVLRKSIEHILDIVKLAGLADEMINFLMKNSESKNLDFSKFICDIFSKADLEEIAYDIKSEINGKFKI
jgi:DNA-binding NtrC family response regulator